jgi:hypothetical protein
MGGMAFDRFFRGINVGGHRAFRPSVLGKELGYDAVNVGAAGTLVIRKPELRAEFLAELRRKLAFTATIAFCEIGRPRTYISRSLSFSRRNIGGRGWPSTLILS